MIGNLANMIGSQIQPQQSPISTQQPAIEKVGNPNPFNGNPFVNSKMANSATFGKNMAVPGGFFAGYYNGRPNIVGSKLFVEV